MSLTEVCSETLLSLGFAFTVSTEYGCVGRIGGTSDSRIGSNVTTRLKVFSSELLPVIPLPRE